MQQFVKFVRHFFISTHSILLWFASGFVQEAPRYKIVALFVKCTTIWRTCPIFTAKVALLYKTMHCGTPIKVRCEKSGTHGAAFSSAAVAHLLHSFVTHTVYEVPWYEMLKSENSKSAASTLFKVVHV